MRLPTPTDRHEWMRRLLSVFDAMDDAYARAAAAAGFHCSGCDDNCCRSHFHHHTLLEYLALQFGLAALQPESLPLVMERAAALCRHPDRRAGAEGNMCPLNLEGRCGVYPFRPMICRLHGIPHELHRPTGETLCGPGCDAFYTRCGAQRTAPIDRTPFYGRLAALEGELRRELGFAHKIRMTVAEMVVSIGAASAAGAGEDDGK